MELSEYKKPIGLSARNVFVCGLWYFVGAPLLRSHWLFASSLRVALLRAFGAQIAKGVTLKPNLYVKYPWKVKIGAHSWIGEGAWLDSIAPIEIGKNVCVSQGVYICSGSHDWSSNSFDLRLQSVHIEDQVWLAAKSIVAPGTIVKEGVVVTMGSVITGSTESWSMYSGNPATKVKARVEDR